MAVSMGGTNKLFFELLSIPVNKGIASMIYGLLLHHYIYLLCGLNGHVLHMFLSLLLNSSGYEDRTSDPDYLNRIYDQYLLVSIN
ncbi:MAG: hypothetical protein ACRBB6_12030 [Neptuniibacter sp.]